MHNLSPVIRNVFSKFMSERSLRAQNLIDYKAQESVRTYGQRIYKGPRVVSNTPKLNMTQNQDSEKKIARKIDRFFEENVLVELFDVDEIQSSERLLRELSDSYEDVNIALRRELGGDYDAQYPDYNTIMQKIDTWLKDSRTETRNRKQSVIQSGLAKLRIEEEFFRSRIARDLASLDAEQAEFVEDFERHTFAAKELMQAYSSIFLRVKEQGRALTTELQDGYDLQMKTLEDFIQTKRDQIKTIKCAEIDAERKRRESEEQKMLDEKKSRDAEAVLVCTNIFDNICDRMAKLETKCKTDVSPQTDLQVMESKKDFKSIDSEYTGILDKILKLSEANPSRYPETKTYSATIADKKAALSKTIDAYRAAVEAEISERDLTEDKIKNASTLGIKLPKFRGYDSKLDYYTFKAEFEKLVSPRISSHLQSDYLKHNYLEGHALELVKEIDDLSQIWERLKSSFGNVSVLLRTKIDGIEASTPLWKVKGDDKIVESIIKIKNLMVELSNMSEKHSVEESLYHSSNISKVFNVLGRNRQVEFTKDVIDDGSSEKSEKEIWNELVKFLDKELRVKERILFFKRSDSKSDDVSGKSRNDDSSVVKHHPAFTPPAAHLECSLCGKSDHVSTTTKRGTKIICYHSCETFALMSVKERFALLKSKHFCFQCLSPGFKFGHKGRCFDAFKCPDPSHNRYQTGLHVLVCDAHKGNKENLELLEKYKAKCIANNPNFSDFTKNISISFHVSNELSLKASSDSEGADDAAIFMFQRIAVLRFEFNVFYDGGCSDMVISKRALDILISLSRAKLILQGPLLLKGVGDVESVCPYGRFEIILPLHNGKEAKMSGICLDKITGTFDPVSLKAAENDLRENYDGNPEDLPSLYEFVGGDTDIMIGIKNNKYFPMELFRMESGLAIYESQFKSIDGSRGVVAGPHKSFNRSDGSVNHVYLTQAALIYCQMHQLGLEIGLLDSKMGMDSNITLDDEENGLDYLVNDPIIESGASTFFNEYYIATPSCLQKFEMVENAGTEASYRCTRCRGCEDCKKSSQVESVSIQEELEQSIIEKSVTVNPDTNTSEAYLPFLCDPTKKLVDNYGRAKKFYEGQVKILNSNPDDKAQLISAMTKLFTLGYAAKVEGLTEQQKKLINESSIRYFLPWFANFSKNSKTTPCRPVFNGSSPTASGYSLNDLLPKGRNNLNNLVQIFIRWLTYACAFCTDIQKMYNTIKLAEKHWCFQLFLWDDELDPSREPQICVITTLIYGVKPSGNQAEHALRVTADMHRIEYPIPNKMIQKDTYVDDCGSGITVLRGGGVDVTASYEEAKSVTDDLQSVLNKGGFQLKGVTFSGCDPPEHLCDKDKSVTLAGIKWFSKADILSLSINDLNFGKKFHGKVSEESVGILPPRLTRRQCASRVGEIYDLNGRFAPLIAQFKLDLHELCTYKIQWNDYIPDELFHKWKSNFDTMEKMREIKFQRCTIPADAVSLDMDTLEMGDSSAKMACSAIYIRFRKKDGSYSCQLVFARTKIIPSDMSLPRAELFAATLNATTGHIVKLALGDRIVDRTSFTDNQVSLFWISSIYGQLKQWVRGRVVEVNRLTNRDDWRYIDTKDNTSDLGTRRGAKISDVSDDSAWVKGPVWASLDKASFPVKSVSQLKLCSEDVKKYNDELIDPNITDNDWVTQQLNVDCNHIYVSTEKGKLDEVALRYEYSKYVIDPNKFSFRKVVRIMGLVLMFIWTCMKRIGKPVPVITGNPLPDRFKFCNDRFLVTTANKFPFVCKQGLAVELTEFYLLGSLNYFFKKASAEIKHFLPESAYKKISKDRLGIMYYTGRILPSQQFNAKIQLSDVCLDLCRSSFCVPLIDRHSPLAYAFVNEVHWYDPDANHSGVETLWRYVLKNVYIMEGRSLVKSFKDQCTRCRYLMKKAIAVAMGPKSCDNLCIAPPFYNTQVDMFGPFNSYSNVNKRAAAKIWFVIFCCCVTGAVDVKVAADYTTESFILAFLRFSCKVGFPRKLMPDAGSQLIKGCENVILSFYDIHNNLSEFGVEFEQCPVGAHYMHGKVERKIKDVKFTFSKHLLNQRLSIIQWETLGCQVANTLNNLPIGIGNVARDLEHIDLITPNRLLMGRNNSRCPSEKMIITQNLGKIIEQNDKIFEVWFRAWLTSCVPNLMMHPKWFKSDSDPQVGDVILFLKSDKEFQKLYQYGMITFCKRSRDGKIREVEIEYQNHTDKSKRHTTRGTKEIVVIHPYQELDLIRQLNILAINAE